MSEYFRAIATDLDGTLTHDGVLNQDSMTALDELRAEGVAALLVTGRVADELDQDFPGLTARFDAVVSENGAVVTTRAGTQLLAPPIELELESALVERGVPCRRGRVLLACDGAHTPIVSKQVERLGLDCQLVHNRAALMVLPSGVSKGRGLFVALGGMGVSYHNTVAVGDAENDLSLLRTAEVGVAVADAVQSLRDHADIHLDVPSGAAVGAIARGALFRGQQRLCPPRHWVRVGEFDDGAPALLPGSQATILVSGDSGTGKSYLAGMLVERWTDAGYTVLVIDPEGDHSGLAVLPGVMKVDARLHLPSPVELISLLRQRFSSVVLDLTALTDRAKTDYVRQLPALIEAERLAHGVPHWVVVDEAHLSTELATTSSTAPLLQALGRGLCLITYRPELLSEHLRLSVDLTVTVLGPPQDTPGGVGLGHAILTDTTGSRLFAVEQRRSEHVRHLHKYTEAQLPEGRRFVFRAASVPPAGNLAEFERAIHRVPHEALNFHAARGDFSRWIAGALQDATLADVVAGVERDLVARNATSVERARAALAAAVNSRYGIEELAAQEAIAAD
ncbi:HAD hydrolase family protein [Pengzhenrongella phosphoraccumulans]|uniref:HAD hydrolase family protein n=1 Tax=Pengzhenrongella phosphoraccumulans TaxID=3114394 RepID=UPI00388F1495